jgi:hypothetical protein
LASVPSGGSGGGAAPAAGSGAAAGGAAVEEEKKEEKEEGMFSEPRICDRVQRLIVLFHREGRVRRGYGFRSFRLIAFHSKLTLAITYEIWQILSEGCWEKLCELNVVLHGRSLVKRGKASDTLLLHQTDRTMRRASTTFAVPAL